MTIILKLNYAVWTKFAINVLIRCNTYNLDQLPSMVVCFCQLVPITAPPPPPHPPSLSCHLWSHTVIYKWDLAVTNLLAKPLRAFLWRCLLTEDRYDWLDQRKILSGWLSWLDPLPDNKSLSSKYQRRHKCHVVHFQDAWSSKLLRFIHTGSGENHFKQKLALNLTVIIQFFLKEITDIPTHLVPPVMSTTFIYEL